ncbi:MAG TPA: HEPN domain-containing protein [Tepidisphaeraceae bacterium]|nr:HEPN domain-containing protein [Tepidisphaeraceae bacterium]
MDTWESIANSNRTAAIRLFSHGMWRSCVSRAYYAVYAAVSNALVKVPIAMPAGREGPNHLPLPDLIGNNLTRLSHGKRWRLSGLVRQLYDLRCLADYRPSIVVEKDEARITLGLMEQAFGLLKDLS